jgi:hypothetical protein
MERLPVEQLTKLTLDEYLRTRASAPSAEGETLAKSEILVIDQFEEILTLDRFDAAEKTEFFRQLGEALRAPRRRALFAMRDEWVGALAPYVHLVPTHLSVRYRLNLLPIESSREAIEVPAREFGTPFLDDALEALLTSLRRIQRPGGGEPIDATFIEPVQLQVVCTRLWRNLPARTRAITKKHVEEIGNVDNALAAFYEENVQQVAGATDDPLLLERRIRRWFDQALITAGVRAQVAEGSEAAYGLTTEIIERLVNAYLVRIEDRHISKWYELAHDRLIPPVKANNRKWFDEHASELENKARAWEAEGRPSYRLLRGRALKEARRWQAEHPEENTDQIKAFLDVSTTDQKAGALRLAAWLVVLLGVAGGVILVLLQKSAELRKKERELTVAQEILRDSIVQLMSRNEALAEVWGIGDERLLSRSLYINNLMQMLPPISAQRLNQYRILYYKRANDRDLESGLRSIGISVEVRASTLPGAQTNAIAFGREVDGETLKRVALAMLRANISLKRICPAQRDTTPFAIQVVGMPALIGMAPLDVGKVLTLSEQSRERNCDPLPQNLVYLQFRSSGTDRLADRRRMEAIRLALQHQGFYAPGVQETGGAFHSSVRYFRREDRALAESVLVVVKRTVKIPLRAELGTGSAQPRQIEVWVDFKVDSRAVPDW